MARARIRGNLHSHQVQAALSDIGARAVARLVERMGSPEELHVDLNTRTNVATPILPGLGAPLGRKRQKMSDTRTGIDRTKRTFLTRKQEVGIYNLLKDHGQQLPDPHNNQVSVFAYLDGWTDEKVLESLSAQMETPGITPNHVGSYRREMFGNFPKAEKKVIVSATLEQRVEKLEACVRMLCRELGADPAKFNLDTPMPQTQAELDLGGGSV